MISFPRRLNVGVVKMVSGEDSYVSERSQAYIFRKQEFKVHQIIEILYKSRTAWFRLRTHQVLHTFIFVFGISPIFKLNWLVFGEKHPLHAEELFSLPI